MPIAPPETDQSTRRWHCGTGAHGRPTSPPSCRHPPWSTAIGPIQLCFPVPKRHRGASSLGRAPLTEGRGNTDDGGPTAAGEGKVVVVVVDRVGEQLALANQLVQSIGKFSAAFFESTNSCHIDWAIDWQTFFELTKRVENPKPLAGPLVAASLLQNILQVISVMFVAHLGELALFGASMATSFAGVTSFSFLKRYGRVLLFTICWAYTCRDTGSILSLFGQDPEIAAEVGAYSRWMIPTLFAYGLIQCHNRFLQTQNIVFPMMLITSVTALLDLMFSTCFSYVMAFATRTVTCIAFVDVSPEELFHNERSFMNEVSKASPMETQSAKEVSQLFNLFKAHKDPKQNPIAYSCNRLRKTSYFFCIVTCLALLWPRQWMRHDRGKAGAASNGVAVRFNRPCVDGRGKRGDLKRLDREKRRTEEVRDSSSWLSSRVA
ncbi:hypothetical protein ZIOFF_000312 [Zingiber officinale]|uniref:Uncharacterized protein n=1 Tax=Zingiber officinale TaxID=94328 RepID=A0A8J5HXC5_ZINOF|nr:hypothetical protein ZIOFF_000312 [Zingiber officinale]